MGPRAEGITDPRERESEWVWDWFDESPHGETYGVRRADEVICYTSRTKKGYEDAVRIAAAANEHMPKPSQQLNGEVFVLDFASNPHDDLLQYGLELRRAATARVLDPAALRDLRVFLTACSKATGCPVEDIGRWLEYHS